MIGRHLFLSDKIVIVFFVIVNMNAFGIDGGRLVLGLLPQEQFLPFSAIFSTYISN